MKAGAEKHLAPIITARVPVAVLCALVVLDACSARESLGRNLGSTAGTSGATGTGGAIGTGGATGSGGTGQRDAATEAADSQGACGVAKSTLSQTYSFATGLGTLIPNYNSMAGAKLAFVTAGPAANPTLCSPASGCAALSVVYSSGTAASAGWVTAYEVFSPKANLLGATVTLSIAVDNPGTQVPFQLQAAAAGDSSTNYSGTAPTWVSGSGLTAYAPTSGFNNISVVVGNYTDSSGTFCASATSFIGLVVQNTADITSANAGTVTVYINKMTITRP